ncbi:hypothetical protein [Arthrobacter burdickii]|uniref:DUF3168 domain-containing protein n=1 Tax=Arthrobacter burdickii TaxID=3035920 RepID=A0ABT8K3C8_9MICC|nr:hypothetical protein [Arthrobacter burdickii]MDN4611951.1 hypothetical protein [Arthrobacter burdickii]
MADPVLLKQAVIDALTAIPGLGGRVHDGALTKAAATDSAGYVLPYVVLFAGIGDNPQETTARGDTPTGALVFDFQTTCVGPGTGQSAGVARDVRTALLNLRIGRGTVRKNPDGFDQPTPVREEGVTPVRYMLPQQWRLITN